MPAARWPRSSPPPGIGCPYCILYARSASVQEPDLQRPLDPAQLGGHVVLVHVTVDVHDDIAEFAVGLKVLSRDVEIAGGEDVVDPPQHARHVAMNVQKPGAAGPHGQADLWEVHGAGHGA